MKAAVLGVGRMGAAIAWAMEKLGFEVLGLDSNEHAAENFRNHISGPSGAFYLTDQNDPDKSMERALLFEKPDIVISSLPYHQNEEIAFWCIDNEMRYADLGGRVDVSKNINDYAKQKAVKPVFTDLGLAPGWVNILTELGCSKIHATPDSVIMAVGGLPKKPNNPPLNYSATWSIDGLLNEYRDDCEALIDGEITTVKGMDGLQLLHIDSFGGDLEAFYTSGGAAHTIRGMKSKGAKYCAYKTIRYPGHRHTMKLLMHACDIPDDCLLRILEKGCVPNKDGDLVIIKSLISAGDLVWDKEIVVFNDDQFSAMQRATAFPISSVASLMAEGALEGNKEQRRDHWLQYDKALSYADVPFELFNKNLISLGI